MTTIARGQHADLIPNPAALWLGNVVVRVVGGIVPSSASLHRDSYLQSRPEGCKSPTETVASP